MSAERRRARPSASWLTAPWRILTPLGRGVVAVGAFAAVLSEWFHWHEFTQLAVLSLGLLLLGLLWQLLPGTPTAEVTLRRHRVVEGSASPSALVDVQAGAAPMLFPKVVVPVGRHRVELRLPFLGPFARHTEEITLPDVPRGVHIVGPVTYEKSDPVGLVARRFRSGQVLELFVSPRVTDLAVFAGGLTNDLEGATSQRPSMSDLAFHALREYVPGDDLRHVHWRSSAKAGELLVRQFHETRRGHVTVLLDATRDSYPRLRDFELAVSVATSIALRAVRDDFDTYLRCGPHFARSRHAAAMTDVACRFVGDAVDSYQAHASAAAETIAGTGLVVQVTGAARDLVQLDAAAQSFGRGADWLVVRADSEHDATMRDSGTLRELSVPDLARLQELLARARR
ncbi:hypothetical protein ASC64_08140 [Nocardioides sp. Root122]|uniref:DUF58 domain-containing protein n=1 Tax=Nocardioides TaxID=1839 RepID=UPI00070264E5|nr:MULTISPECIES: DUF58 domain-containing protein [Nocardioides]KQV69784.1 hypothetical protein ASC64_08140 [Nocardioides sp. Root122]MCK9823009.1 DUF58 domain-containing protein [Nocardioides cavernae]